MANRQVCNILGRQVRSFSSTPSTAAKANQPPIQVYGLEGRYAHAIFSAAASKQQLPAVEKDFAAIQTLFTQNKGLKEILSNPLLTKEQRANAVKEIGAKKNEITVNTLSLLADNGRLGRLQKIGIKFAELLDAHHGNVQAKVTTAKPLDAKQTKELEAVLATFLEKGKTLQLNTVVNADLIGGFVVELGDRFIDLSISSRLKNYSDIVKQTL
jgi:F-type H+-transporting ATPase subunit O